MFSSKTIRALASFALGVLISGCDSREPITGNNEGPKRPAWTLEQKSNAGKGVQPWVDPNAKPAEPSAAPENSAARPE